MVSLSPSEPYSHHDDLADTILARQSGSASLSQQLLAPPRGGQEPFIGPDEPPRITSKSIVQANAERVLLRPVFVESPLQVSGYSELQSGLEEEVVHQRDDNNGLYVVHEPIVYLARPDVLSPMTTSSVTVTVKELKGLGQFSEMSNVLFIYVIPDVIVIPVSHATRI